MTDDTTPQTAIETRPAPDTDWFLQLLVEMVNDSDGMEIGVTLFLGGSVISGLLTSYRKYFEDLGAGVERGKFHTPPGGAPVDAEGKKKFGDTFRTIGAKQVERSKELPDDERPEPQFIHLRDALVISASGPAWPTNGGMWWRGRISRIDGFLVGNIENRAS